MIETNEKIDAEVNQLRELVVVVHVNVYPMVAWKIMFGDHPRVHRQERKKKRQLTIRRLNYMVWHIPRNCTDWHNFSSREIDWGQDRRRDWNVQDHGLREFRLDQGQTRRGQRHLRGRHSEEAEVSSVHEQTRRLQSTTWSRWLTNASLNVYNKFLLSVFIGFLEFLKVEYVCDVNERGCV